MRLHRVDRASSSVRVRDSGDELAVTGPVEALRAELGADPPPAVAALAPAHLEALTAALAAARAHQAAALADAMDSGLGFVPRLLRGAVKKVLFG
jgi:hypothetical protein